MKRALVTGGTKEDIAPIATFIINIKEKNCKLYDDLIIFHNGIKAKDKAIIKQIEPSVKFIKYKYPNNKLKILVNRTIRYFSPMIFCKYECIRLLHDYQQVIWSDYDVVIQKELSELKRDTDTPLLIPIAKEMPLKMMFKANGTKRIKGFDLEGKSLTTPLMVINDTIGNIDELYNWCYNMTDKWSNEINYPEQCIITMLVQQYQIQHKELSLEKYVCFAQQPSEDASILHAYGQPKFWNGLDNKVWNSNYQKWLLMGGSPYEQQKKNIITRWIN